MPPASTLISVDEARLRMLAAVTPLGAENVSADAIGPGRVLAEDVVAARPQPPFRSSAMDGWAVRQGGAEYAVVGESAAGAPFGGELGAGEAVRIFTGAAVPDGVDTVVIQEDAVVEGARVRFTGQPKCGANIRPLGGDFQAGDLLLARGQVLGPCQLALAAAAGRGEVRVARSPRIALVACGDELAQPGNPAAVHQIYESVTPALAMKVRAWGGTPSRALLPDSAEAICAALTASDADLIVTVGGASVGDRDLMKAALADLGAELLVNKVAMRPGKPVFFARLPDGTLLLGLPGNPASAMVCAELFLWPLMRALQGADPHRPLNILPLAAAMGANGPREHWMRGRIEGGAVSPFPDQDSSLVSVLSRSNALIRRLAGAPAAHAGEPVGVLRLEP
ncbi:MAG TPA: molybdopterin molybdotransferase MoeA [Caulobacteraceae bacterium]|nr:molybdopterin molybdotransferase MoeA [Caulobacteraceae bacterium]